MLRLRDNIAAADGDNDIQSAIDEFVSRESPEPVQVEYEEDPRLDTYTKTESGVVRFEQPWPDGTGELLLECTEVAHYPFNLEGNMLERTRLLDGIHRRVTLERTGEVEDIAVVGHWRTAKFQPLESGIIGCLPRPVVRQLDREHLFATYAGRIHSAQRAVVDNQAIFQVFIDVAIESEDRRRKRKKYFK